MHRRLALLAACLALAACSQEPDFDRQYEAKQQELENRARAMDNRIEAHLEKAPQAKQDPPRR